MAHIVILGGGLGGTLMAFEREDAGWGQADARQPRHDLSFVPPNVSVGSMAPRTRNDAASPNRG